MVSGGGGGVRPSKVYSCVGWGGGGVGGRWGLSMVHVLYARHSACANSFTGFFCLISFKSTKRGGGGGGSSLLSWT